MPRFKDQAIVLRSNEWSESSQIVVLLTEAHGKVRGLAKGSKRQSPSSLQRFSGGIELLTTGQVVATTRPSSELAAVTEWDLQNDHFRLRRDFRGQRLAMYAADLCHAMLADGDVPPAPPPPPETGERPGAFALLAALLETLCDAERKGVAAQEGALLRFQWGLLVDCGYRPELDRDVRTGEPLGPAGRGGAYGFDPLAGGLTTGQGPADWRVRASTVDVLRRVAAGEERPGGGDGAGVADPGVGRANRLLCVYARSILDRELPTMGVVLARSGV